MNLKFVFGVIILINLLFIKWVSGVPFKSRELIKIFFVLGARAGFAFWKPGMLSI